MTLYKTVASIDGGIQVEMTADEEAAFLAAQSAAVTFEAASALKSQAQLLLDKSDITVLRCYENAVVVPSEWATYRASLRSIVKNGTGTIPTQPSYPSGT